MAKPSSPRLARETAYPSAIRISCRELTMAGSSSIKRILGRSFIVFGLGQDYSKNRSVVDSRLVLQDPSMFLDNAGGDWEPQAGAALFGGEKRIEKPLLHIRRHPFSGISDFQNHDC